MSGVVVPVPETSLDLLARLKAGDASALDRLIARYRPRLVRWASGRLPAAARGLSETQDLVQEVLIQAFRRIGEIEIRGEGSLQAYLRTVLLNAIRMEIRKARRRPAVSELAVDVEAPDPSPLQRVIGVEMLDRYDKALDSLKPEERDLVVAHIEFGFSHQEMAEAFARPSANAARMALQRALLNLADRMRDRA